ncbi:MAG: serine/threonine-protein phosphatase [Actinomycetota bacterium]|nr:serine/threonine-protein phosphatase [Actinomycetota bacterium]
MTGTVVSDIPPRGRTFTHARRALRASTRTGDDNRWLIALVCFTFVITVVAGLGFEWFPLSTFVVPLVAGSLVLERRHLMTLTAVVAAGVLATVVVAGATPPRVAWAVVMIVLAVILLVASYRSRLGAAGRLGESMLIDLRDRLQTQSELPALPEQWYAQAIMRSAGGAQFAGDFIVAARTGPLLEVVVVDVSGKGLAAGTRALQLSGAFGGLLGALPPEQFLPAANAYLLRQDWGEGFATAAHLAVSLDTGTLSLRTAGHPPGLHFHAGSGRWEVLDSYGPALGLIEGADFEPVTGGLDPDDALMIYTDGLVETPERDFTLGIDKLLGEAERMLSGGWENSAERLLERLDSAGDDRAILFLHRR